MVESLFADLVHVDPGNAPSIGIIGQSRAFSFATRAAARSSFSSGFDRGALGLRASLIDGGDALNYS